MLKRVNEDVAAAEVLAVIKLAIAEKTNMSYWDRIHRLCVPFEHAHLDEKAGD